VNGLYERVLIERYKFGGRPGQVEHSPFS